MAVSKRYVTNWSRFTLTPVSPPRPWPSWTPSWTTSLSASKLHNQTLILGICPMWCFHGRFKANHIQIWRSKIEANLICLVEGPAKRNRSRSLERKTICRFFCDPCMIASIPRVMVSQPAVLFLPPEIHWPPAGTASQAQLLSVSVTKFAIEIWNSFLILLLI